MAGRVTIFRFDDGDAAIERARTLDERLRDVAIEHGARQRITARKGDTVLLINVWDTAEGSDAMAEDPRVLAVLSELGFDGPPPNREVLELVESVIVAEAAPSS
jgi:hypothetical protein